MTSTGVLPSTGPPPPELRRPYIPTHLRPDLPDAKQKLLEGRKPSPRAASDTQTGEAAQAPKTRAPKSIVIPKSVIADEPGTGEPARTGGLAGAGRNLGGLSAIAVQLSESLAGAAAEQAPLRAPLEPLDPADDLSGQPGLSDEDLAEIARLSARDREVRAHEAAHAAAGQGYTGATAFDYVRGPDGLQYAVGGHIAIDVKPVDGNPAATIDKMEVVQRAALAPARPSGQDRAVAAQAAARIREAERQAAAERKDLAAEAGDPQVPGLQPAGIDLIA